MDVEYITTASDKSQFPEHHIPEIAFVGRSNVGKSSLINTLVNRKRLAYISNTPGKTKTINFYRVNHEICFVDLPGYGFARVPHKIKKRWKNLIESYLTERDNLKLVILIIDIRHEPSNDDRLMKQWLDSYGINNVVVATKLDKISKNQKEKSINAIIKSFKIISPMDIIPFSSVTGEGKREVWKKIMQYTKKGG